MRQELACRRVEVRVGSFMSFSCPWCSPTPGAFQLVATPSSRTSAQGTTNNRRPIWHRHLRVAVSPAVAYRDEVVLDRFEESLPLGHARVAAEPDRASIVGDRWRLWIDGPARDGARPVDHAPEGAAALSRARTRPRRPIQVPARRQGPGPRRWTRGGGGASERNEDETEEGEGGPVARHLLDRIGFGRPAP